MSALYEANPVAVYADDIGTFRWIFTIVPGSTLTGQEVRFQVRERATDTAVVFEAYSDTQPTVVVIDEDAGTVTLAIAQTTVPDAGSAATWAALTRSDYAWHLGVGAAGGYDVAQWNGELVIGSPAGAFLRNGTGNAKGTTLSVPGDTLPVPKKEMINVTGHQFNVVPGSADIATRQTAVEAAVAYVSGKSRLGLYFPPGAYWLNSGLDVNPAGYFTMEGEGPTSELVFTGQATNAVTVGGANPDDGAISFITIKGLRIASSDDDSTGVGLTLQRLSRSQVLDVDVQDFKGGIDMQGCSSTKVVRPFVLTGSDWSSLKAGSYGLRHRGYTPSVGDWVNPVGNHIIAGDFTGVDKSGSAYLEAGLWIEACDGVYVHQGRTGHCKWNIRVRPENGVGTGDIQTVKIIGHYLDGATGWTQYNLRVDPNANHTGEIRDLQILGGTIDGATVGGVLIDDDVRNGIIAGVNFRDLPNAIIQSAAATVFRIGPNVYENITTADVNYGGAEAGCDDHDIIGKAVVARGANETKVRVNGIYESTNNPTTAENAAAGYENGDRHLNTSTEAMFVLVDDVAGTWTSITAGAAGGGDAWGDPVDADIVPDGDGTRDLGTNATRFAETYTDALAVTNNITVGGTVDGRDLATDGTKLDGIEAAADVTDEANVTAALDGATVAEKVTPASGDKFLIQDNAAADELKWVDHDNLPSGGSSLPVDDTTALVRDPVDNTKLARIDAGAITTATTRVITMGDRDVDLASGGTFAEASHTHATTDITSGTLADARVAESNVTQHEAAINHDALTNFVANEHVNHTAVTVTVSGDANEITVAEGAQDISASRTFTVGIADNAVFPGTEAVQVPSGTTAQRDGTPTNGQVRYNTTTAKFEGYENGAWADIIASASGEANTASNAGTGGVGVFDGKVSVDLEFRNMQDTATIEWALDAGNKELDASVVAASIDTAELADDGVTYTKMQDVSATDRLLGRQTAGAGVVEEITCTAAGRALLDDADASAQRTTLGLAIGTDVQAQDDLLQDIADIAGTFTADGEMIVATGVGAAAIESGATLRTSIGCNDAANLTTGTIPAARVGADHIDAITEIAAALRTGSDADLVTGTAGTSGNLAQWNADGDLVDASVAAPSGTIREVGKSTIWIPAAAMKETVSNGCAAITEVEIAAAQPNLSVLDFDATADEHAQFSIAFPKAWNLSTVTFQVFWTVSAAVSTGVAWGLQGVAISDNAVIGAAYGTAIVVTDDAQGASNELLVSAESSAVTIAGTPADDDLCFFRIFRDVSDANDDMTQDARLIGVKLFYTTDAANDA